MLHYLMNRSLVLQLKVIMGILKNVFEAASPVKCSFCFVRRKYLVIIIIIIIMEKC